MKKYEKEFYKILAIFILYFGFVSTLIHVSSSDFDAISNVVNIFFLLVFLSRGYYLIKYGGASGPLRYDEITNLNSLSNFREKLNKLILDEKITESRKTYVLAMVKLDRFKDINDKFGYDFGDKVLKEFSSRILSKVSVQTLVARGNGSEFYILFPTKKEAVKQFFLKNTTYLTTNISVDEKSTQIGISIGISGSDYASEGIFKEAELSLKEAKNLGGNKFVIYSDELKRKDQEKSDIIDGLGSAISENEIDVFFQPKVNVKENRIEGVESLIRWNRRDKKSFSPAIFIPIAEESGQIKKIGAYVFIKACELIKQISSTHPNMNVAVNVSPIQLRDPNFLPFIRKTMQKYKINPESIELEITEGVFIGDDNISTKMIRDIKNLGVKVSIDDFGTGYSSFSYLKNIEIDCIKLDKIFIDDIETSTKGRSLVRGMIDMAHNLSCKVVAEGVENEAQKDFLRAISCDYIQGYYYSKPLSKRDLLEKIKDQ